MDGKLIKLFDDAEDICDSINLSQCLFYFLQLCKNGGVKLPKSTIEEALSKCQNEKCSRMLKQHITTEYEKMSQN